MKHPEDCNTLTATLIIEEIFPLERKIEYKYNYEFLGENNVFTISSEFKLGHQYKIEIAKGAKVKCGNDEGVDLIYDVGYDLIIRVFDFEIDSVEVRRDKGVVKVRGKNFEVYNPHISINGRTVEYRTTSLKAELYVSNKAIAEESTRNLEPLKFRNIIWTDTVITFTGVDFNNIAGDLLLTLDIYRECVCISPSPCTCSKLPSRNKATGYLHGGGKLDKITIGKVTCTPVCYTPKRLTGDSCTYVDLPYTKPIKRNYKCTGTCKKVVRTITEGDYLLLECVEGCSGNEYSGITREQITGNIYEMCGPCHSSCASCKGPEADSCTKCINGLNEYRKHCLNRDTCTICDNNYPKFVITIKGHEQKAYKGFCIEEEVTKYKLNDKVKIEVIGYADAYKNRRDPIQLMLSGEKMSFKDIKWKQVGIQDPILFTSGTDNLPVANISYRYVFTNDITVPLIVSVSAKACTSSEECKEYFDLIAVNHTFNVKTVEFTLNKDSGNVRTSENEFEAYLNNVMILEGTEVELKSNCPNVHSPIDIKGGHYNNKFTLTTIEFRDWSILYKREKNREFTVTAEIRKGIERFVCSTPVYLSNEISSREKARIADTFLKEPRIRLSTLTEISMILTDFYITEKDFICTTDAECGGVNTCKKSKCDCMDIKFESGRCSYIKDYTTNIGRIKDKIEENINTIIKELEGKFKNAKYEWSNKEFVEINKEFTTLALNMAKLSEIVGVDMTGNIDKLLTDSSPLLAPHIISKENIEGIERMVRAASAIINVKLKNYEEKEDEKENIQAQERVSNKTISMVKFIEAALANAINAIPPGNSFEFSNDYLAVSLSNDDSHPSGERTYYLSSKGAVIRVPFFVLNQVYIDGSIRTRMVEWKVNPYENSALYGRDIRSTVIGFSFLNENSDEIKINTPVPISLKIPLLNKDITKKIEYSCMYFDHTVVNFTSSTL